MSTLHYYRCKTCQTVATTPVLHDFGRPLCCNLCHCYMRWMFAEPVTTPEQEALYKRGPVWNPGISQPPNAELPKCDVCGEFASIVYGVLLMGVGRFCSAGCAEEGVRRHEAAMSPKADEARDV